MGRITDAIDALRGRKETRADHTNTFQLAQYQAMQSMGITDTDRPNQWQIRQFNQGLFSTLIKLRSDSIGAALSDCSVVRNTGQMEVEPVEFSHPWVQLLRRPNEYRPAAEIWRWAAMVRDYHGSADFLVETNRNGVPIALHEIFPEFGELKPISDGRGGVQSYIFERADGRRIPLRTTDVIRLRHTDPLTPYGSASLLERAAYQLDKQLYSDVYERDQLKEGRFPPVSLVTEQTITNDQALKYGKQFKDNYQRTGSVKGIPVLGNGMKPHVTGLTANDLALIDSQKLTIQQLFFITGVPQGMLDATANRANAEAARYVFAQYTIAPEADSMAAQLTLGLEKAFRADAGVLAVQVADVVPVDELERAQIDEIKMRMGAITPNEIRKRDGDDPVDGGDTPMIGAMLMPLSDVGF